MNLFKNILRLGAEKSDPGEALAQLICAAEDDEAFRRQLLVLLRLPALQRESRVNTALHEMRLRGESPATCLAFAALATDEGARTALELLLER